MPLGHFLYFVEADKPYCNLNGKKKKKKNQSKKTKGDFS